MIPAGVVANFVPLVAAGFTSPGVAVEGGEEGAGAGVVVEGIVVERGRGALELDLPGVVGVVTAAGVAGSFFSSCIFSVRYCGTAEK
jgi:hypothetical protein